MQTVFAGFKLFLGKLRKRIEACDEIDGTDVDRFISELSDGENEFYAYVVRVRTGEYFKGKIMNKKSVLRMLSLWETDL